MGGFDEDEDAAMAQKL